MILTFAVSGYRSLRDLTIPLDQLTVVTGSNGSGKSNLYKAIKLLADVAQGRVIGALAAEGGLQSTLWAGPESFSRGMKSGDVPVQGTVRRNRISLKLGFADEDYGYAIDLGLPKPDSRSLFGSDPEIKAEAIWAGNLLKRSSTLAYRAGPGVHVRAERGKFSPIFTNLPTFDSMMTHASDPRRAPELLALRERMRAWRFYDRLRTDQDALSRSPQIGTRTFALASDGADLGAAFQTIREIGDAEGLADAIEDAFPGSSVDIDVTNGRFEILMKQQGLLRPLHTAELSDGTLRYLLLIVALFTPRAPPLIVLNEPETSLHRSLIEPLGRLIASASKRSQIIVVTHSSVLADALAIQQDSVRYELLKELGETVIDTSDYTDWTWPNRKG